ncbi:RNA-binding protein [Schizosaccharomyces japonicus yFS275]|uniref:RNA-binding protein n=1 Tax=Schizosaccharomyces japonicus (strain yFS275 / FY16936) TaxID=402676 RepID=B6K044_SCHJY|nr:RNA-binding protein [Schizosaccharomyces japonicus yFS275]EEB06194.1 RNA-binding protein [Schizosaccharomyces japonicus yFS275]
MVVIEDNTFIAWANMTASMFQAQAAYANAYQRTQPVTQTPQPSQNPPTIPGLRALQNQLLQGTPPFEVPTTEESTLPSLECLRDPNLSILQTESTTKPPVSFPKAPRALLHTLPPHVTAPSRSDELHTLVEDSLKEEEESLDQYKALFCHKRPLDDYVNTLEESGYRVDETNSFLKHVEGDRYHPIDVDVAMSKRYKLTTTTKTTRRVTEKKTTSTATVATTGLKPRVPDGTVVGASAPPLRRGKGLKLLQSMGWSEGLGLGSSNQGVVEPVKAVVKNNKRGLSEMNAEGVPVQALSVAHRNNMPNFPEAPKAKARNGMITRAKPKTKPKTQAKTKARTKTKRKQTTRKVTKKTTKKAATKRTTKKTTGRTKATKVKIEKGASRAKNKTSAAATKSKGKHHIWV